MDWPLITLAYLFTPAGRLLYISKLRESGITVLPDENVENLNPQEIDYHLYLGDDFRRNFDSSDISDDKESNENSFDDDQNQTSNSITDNNGITYCLYDSENMMEKKWI